MKIIHKISNLQVKRCFVVGNLCAARTHKGHMKKVESQEHYLRRVATIKDKVLRMNEAALDKIIGSYKKRLDAYTAYEWHLAEVSPSEVGVWNRAGELPLRWTNHSLVETADKVRRALGRRNGFKRKHIRAAHAIPGILKTSIDVIQNEDYLLPIVFRCDTGTQGRRRLKHKMKGDIDDGCMRSISLAVMGVKKIKVYFGTPR